MIVGKFKQLYQDLNASNIDSIESLYASEAIFHDPFHQIKGLNNLKDYFEELYLNVDAISFEYGETISSDDKHFIAWVMNLTHPKLNKGKAIKVPGASHIQVNNAQQIIMHRDYFDAGVMLYEQLPFVGSLIRLIKSRL